ncbi:MAG: sugar phosphate nucleotidyltransferase [Cyclobacteriaceae bacterium]|nr:sugar phosphate nucleotidyltransferase [Cyclobacteriaceae bacterium]
MKPTLLILAAGMGSRYGGLKQLDPLGPNGETLIDYSIHDAIQAGFGKVVFIIRKHFEKEFKNKVSDKFSSKIEVVHVFQELDSLVPIEVNREKPWGTGHAILVAKDVIDEPFAVINADDYYGQSGFKLMAKFLSNQCSQSEFSMVGYRIKNTLSDHGSVSRGVCSMDSDNYLIDVVERTKIEKSTNNSIIYIEGEESFPLAPETIVSMNFWGFHPTVFPFIEQQFNDFVMANQNNLKAEFFIPLYVNDMLQRDIIKLKVLESEDKWFGVTYKEDKETVMDSFLQLVKNGIYPSPLWS